MVVNEITALTNKNRRNVEGIIDMINMSSFNIEYINCQTDKCSFTLIISISHRTHKISITDTEK